MTDLRLVNRWLALAGGVLSGVLSLYIWVIVDGAKGVTDLWLALAQCLLLAAGGYFAASLLLKPGLQERFGRLALLLPVTLWAITFLILIRVALGYWSKSPMLVFERLLPIQIVLLALGGAIFGIIDLLFRYLTNRSTRRAQARVSAGVSPAQESPMPPVAPSVHQEQTDYIFLGIVCVLIFGVYPIGVATFSLQRLLLQPADSVLFGPTPDGELMLVVPIILICSLASFRVAWILARWIRRRFRMPDKELFPDGAWAKSVDWRSIQWRLAGGIAGVLLVLVAATGFGSYVYVTERGVSVRSPLEFSIRHYAWQDVATVRVRCRDSISKTQRQFRYVLEMSNGQDVNLSKVLNGASAELRAAAAVRFAEFIPAHLTAVPSIRYEFDVSRDGLVLLGERRGQVLPHAIREQVLSHGGTVQ